MNSESTGIHSRKFYSRKVRQQHSMKNIKFRILWFALALMASVFLTVCIVRFQGQIARQKHNYALIAAIKADNFDAAQHLLANGANPNARDLPPDTRTLWRRVCEMFRPVQREETLFPSALTLALRRDIDAQKLAPPEISFLLIKALHDAGATQEKKHLPPAEAALQEAEQWMTAAPDTPVGSTMPTLAQNDAADALKIYLNGGMSAQAMADLAYCRFRTGDYAGAVHAYRIAALWRASDTNLQTRLAQAQVYQRGAEAIKRTLPDLGRVFLVRPFPSAAVPGAWIALYGSDSNERGGALEDAQAALY